MNNLTQSHLIAAHSLDVQYLAEHDIPLALGLISSVKSSGSLMQPYHLKDRDAEELTRIAQDGYPLLGIKNHAGQLVSFATVSPLNGDTQNLIIRSICTHPDYQNRGCSGKILTAALQWLALNDIPVVRAKVACDNMASYTLFSKTGFIAGDVQWDADNGYHYYMMEKKHHSPSNFNYQPYPLKTLLLT
ncbi:MAG TPA: hypothetical protein DCM27_07790 [Rhodospirillaceae bacterium]|nr:hypothetical protein [Rhodospirillaceae bacterium]